DAIGCSVLERIVLDLYIHNKTKHFDHEVPGKSSTGPPAQKGGGNKGARKDIDVAEEPAST
ncbi:unnamed protein product, partial [Amoebophrya sp. A25]